MVTLTCGKQKLETTERHAQSLLYIQKEMRLDGWKLPKDSPYQFIDNALIKRANKEDCKDTPKSKGTRAGAKASGKTEVSHGDNPA